MTRHELIVVETCASGNTKHMHTTCNELNWVRSSWDRDISHLAYS